MAVYLIHSDVPLGSPGRERAQHYLGWAPNVEERFQEHKKGTGAAFTRALNEKGIDYKIVRVWPEGDRKFERKMKNLGQSWKLCPICRARAEERQRIYGGSLGKAHQPLTHRKLSQRELERKNGRDTITESLEGKFVQALVTNPYNGVPKGMKVEGLVLADSKEQISLMGRFARWNFLKDNIKIREIKDVPNGFSDVIKEELITEIGDTKSGYPYRFVGGLTQAGTHNIAEFFSNSGLRYLVGLKEVNGYLDVDFSTDTYDVGLTGKNEQYKIMGTIVSIIHDVLQVSPKLLGIRYNPVAKNEEQSAAFSGDLHISKLQRNKIYKAFIEKQGRPVKFEEAGGTVFATFLDVKKPI